MTSQETAAQPDREIHYASRGSSYYDVILAVFCVVLVVSNIAATKATEFGSGDLSLGPVQIWPIISDGGAVLFPLAYILGDVMSEVYGFKAARRAILVGFGTAIMTFATFLIVMAAAGRELLRQPGGVRERRLVRRADRRRRRWSRTSRGSSSTRGCSYA